MADDSSHQPANSKYKVPTGFRTLLECLSREVLRNQPSDIYEFSALFLEKLQQFRHGLSLFLVIKHENPECDILRTTDVYYNLRQSIAKEASDRGLLHHEEFAPISGAEDQAASKIQAAFKGYQVRAKPEKFGLPSDAAVIKKYAASPSAEHPEINHQEGGGTEENPVEHAATKIQAEVRGFLQRKHYKEIKDELDHAATRIQATFKGYTTRKTMVGGGPKRTADDGSGTADDAKEQAQRPASAEGHLNPNEDEAATKIQATFKGHLVRLEHKKQEDAATKIQAAFKGHLVRHGHSNDNSPSHEHPNSKIGE